MGLFAFFAVSVLAATAVHVAGQEGFLSIDCGMDAAITGRQDADTRIAYVSDSPYVDSGENHRVAADQESNAGESSMLTLRSFPSGVRNAPHPEWWQVRDLIRMMFFHGNYDGKNKSSSMKFDLHLGTNNWEAVRNVKYWWSEAVFVAWASWVPVCLLNIGSGTPFVHTAELRQLGAPLYPDVTAKTTCGHVPFFFFLTCAALLVFSTRVLD